MFFLFILFIFYLNERNCDPSRIPDGSELIVSVKKKILCERDCGNFSRSLLFHYYYFFLVWSFVFVCVKWRKAAGLTGKPLCAWKKDHGHKPLVRMKGPVLELSRETPRFRPEADAVGSRETIPWGQPDRFGRRVEVPGCSEFWRGSRSGVVVMSNLQIFNKPIMAFDSLKKKTKINFLIRCLGFLVWMLKHLKIIVLH